MVVYTSLNVSRDQSQSSGPFVTIAILVFFMIHMYD